MNMPSKLIAVALSLLAVTSEARSADVDFAKEIKPIFERSCLKCHGPEKPKAGLRLDTQEGFLKGSKGGKVVVAGKADDSRLYEVITLPKDDPDHMPAEGEPLTKEQADLIRDWINQGPKWPDGLVLQAPAAAPETKAAAVPVPPTEPGVPISDAEKAAVAKLQHAHALALRLPPKPNPLGLHFST